MKFFFLCSVNKKVFARFPSKETKTSFLRPFQHFARSRTGSRIWVKLFWVSFESMLYVDSDIFTVGLFQEQPSLLIFTATLQPSPWPCELCSSLNSLFFEPNLIILRVESIYFLIFFFPPAFIIARLIFLQDRAISSKTAIGHGEEVECY